MNSEEVQDFKKAGQIAAKARDFGASLIKEGKKAVEILDEIENKIHSLGGGIAFPAQISFNHIAAHYCSTEDDQTTIKSSDVIKLDVGAHVNGFIGDTATTVNLDGQYKELLESSKTALNNAIKEMKAGIRTGDVGKTIQETISSFGFKPISNLSGHGLGKFQIHTDPRIPNIFQPESPVLHEGMTVAIEPFATDGEGKIQDGGIPTLFSQMAERPVRSPITREVFKKIKSYNGLPFTTRWLSKEFGIGKTALALRELQKVGNIYTHPPLGEIKKGIVSQHEHSVIVTDKGVEVTTKTE